MSKKDPLIGRQVRINDDASTLTGKPLPEAGKVGTITGKTPSGKQYQVRCNNSEWILNLPMAEFTILPQSGEDSQPADTATAGPRSTLHLSALVPSRTNRHIADDTDLRDLAASIKAYGVLQPILVRKLPGERLQDTFEDEATRHATHEIVAGERRWCAAKIAGLRHIPVLERDLDGSTALVMQLLENLQRQDLNPIDEALGIHRLIEEHGYTREQAADALRKSRTHVFEAQRILQLCPEAIAAIRAGTLNRSVALLVAQRPTQALQVEFTKRVLTSGPDGTPLSYRSAKDLAQRNYMTDLSQAPFQLSDAVLVPKAGACTSCPKRTGASPELWDKGSADVCTDTACFADKKEAHYERLTLEAKARGQTIITGREAREIMPTEGISPSGYILLDKPRKNPETGVTEAPLRQVLGQDVPAAKVVLIESPSGAMIEAMTVRTASEALQQAKGASTKPASTKAPTKYELETDYETRWRRAAVERVIAGLDVATMPDRLPYGVAHRLITNEAGDASMNARQCILGGTGDLAIMTAAANAAAGSLQDQMRLLLKLAAASDMYPAIGKALTEAPQITALADLASVDIAAIQAEVQAEMKAEAAERAAAAKPASADKAKPVLKSKGKAGTEPKTTKADATAAIAEALQAAESQSTDTPDSCTEDTLYREARHIVITEGKASISHLQRTLRIGYNATARLLKRMEEEGMVSVMSADGTRALVQQGLRE